MLMINAIDGDLIHTRWVQGDALVRTIRLG
jgi:hypothetical protein